MAETRVPWTSGRCCGRTGRRQGKAAHSQRPDWDMLDSETPRLCSPRPHAAHSHQQTTTTIPHTAAASAMWPGGCRCVCAAAARDAALGQRAGAAPGQRATNLAPLMPSRRPPAPPHKPRHSPGARPARPTRARAHLASPPARGRGGAGEGKGVAPCQQPPGRVPSPTVRTLSPMAQSPGPAPQPGLPPWRSWFRRRKAALQ